MNTLRSILFLSTIVFLATAANAQWVLTNGPVGGAIRSFAASGTNLFAATESGGVSVTTNNGSTWTPVIAGLTNTNARCLVFHPQFGGAVFAGTSGGGVFKSTNQGANWSASNSGLTNLSVLSLAVYSNGQMFAGTGDGVFRAPNSGAIWTAFDGGLRNNLPVNSFVFIGSNIFAGTDDGVFHSTINGTTWTAANAGLTNIVVSALAVVGTSIYAATGGGVFRSLNNGANWFDVNVGLSNLSVRTLATSGDSIFAGTLGGGVFLTTNGGTSWTTFNTGFTNLQTYSLLVQSPYIYAGTNTNGAWRRAIALFVDNRIPDLTLPDGARLNKRKLAAAPPLFGGNKGTLTFTTTSSNTQFVEASILAGDTLQVRGKINTGGTAVTVTVTARDIDNSTLSTTFSVTVTGTTDAQRVYMVPTHFELYQNYPNPFNPMTTIEFSIPKQGSVVLVIYNALGMEIETLVDLDLPAGHHRTQWTPRDIPSGVYFYQLRSSELTETKTLLLLR